MSRPSGVLGVALGILVAALAVFAVTAQAGVGSSAHFEQVQRAAATPPGGHALGAPSATAAQSGFVVLKPRNNAELERFIASVAKPHTASYHHYLQAGQFEAKFGPLASTIDAVKAQLTKDGLKVGTVSKNGLLIPFTGTTTQVESAFNTTLERYRTQAGVTGQLATTAVKLPSTIAPDVTSVIGLDTLIHPEAALTHPPKSAYSKHPAAKTGKITHYPAGAPNPGADTTDAACVATDGGSAATEAAESYGGLTDDQIANAYGAFNEYDAGDYGQGVHIALYELEPFSLSDLQTFDECYYGDTEAATMSGAGTSGTGNVSVIPVDGGQPSGAGSGEAILDIEDLSGIAPEADIDVYEAPNTTAGGIDDYAQIVDRDTDQIISSSWGECEQDEQLYDPGAQEAENYIFEQAAAQGQTVLNAAGDTGNDTCNEVRTVPPPTDQNPLSVEDPASQPYVVAVGGTTIQDADPSNYDETVWNDGAYWGGGGGGISQSWTMPSWQADSLVPGISDAKPGGVDWNNANDVEENAESLGISNQNWTPDFCQSEISGATTATPCRALPDVSAQADEFTGAITVYISSYEVDNVADTGWVTFGGTSSATPIWAALLALVDESAGCNSIKPSSGGAGIGFALPMLYEIASDPTQYQESFHDITVGNNDDFDFDNGTVFPARTGYDMATGLGSPILTSPAGGTGLAANLCALATSSTARPVVTSLDPTAGPVAGGTSVTVTGTGFESDDSPDVTSVQVGGATVSGSAIAVDSNTKLVVTMPSGASAAAPPSSTETDSSTKVTSVTGGSTQTQDGAGPANVVVTTSDGASSEIAPASEYSYVDENNSSQTIPTVSSVGPYAGLETAPAEVTVYGSGFADDDTVTVGGLAATVDQVVSAYEMKITPPAYSPTNTDCVTAAALTTETGDAHPAADDICQTQVEVVGPNGPSKTSTIYPTYEGTALMTNQDDLPEVPQGYEDTPQPTEYDYIPAPTITSVSTSSGNPATLADDEGGTVITITGTGLGYQTSNWFDIGPTNEATSVDYDETYYSGTKVELVTPATPDANAGTPDADSEAIPIYADTMADASDVHASESGNVIYAGVPVVEGVLVDSTSNNPGGNVDSTYELPVAPSTGGESPDTSLTIEGEGFSDAEGPLVFLDSDSDFSENSDYSYNVDSDSEIDGYASSTNPAIDDVLVCTVSGCSTPTSALDSTADEVLFYPPGDPVITSITPSSGPAAGGQTVTINGENLGCATTVDFGSTAALSVTPTEALLDCGSTSSLTVVAPPGTLSHAVTITLSTVETDATGDDPASSPTKFTYNANPTVSPTTVEFGSAVPGATGATKTVTVTNPAGAADLDVGELSIAGSDPNDFTIYSDNCSGVTLTTGAEKCTVKVQFSPTAAGNRSAELDIPFDDATHPLVVSLKGTAASTTTCTIVHTYKYKTVYVTVTVDGKTKRVKKRKLVESTTKHCTTTK